MSPVRALPSLLVSALLLLSAAACMGPRTQVYRSGVMQYLYPKRKDAPALNPSEARLQLPLRLGVAFVPGPSDRWRPETFRTGVGEKVLLDRLVGAFKGKPWIADIQVIPTSYLTPQGGFENLDQIAAMFGVSVVALVSVDQIQYTDPKWYSFAYLSILGAYVLPGEANDTRTLIDAAVFDVASRAFLLRAPGQSLVKGSSTPVGRDKRLREDAAKGLDLAMADLAGNLGKEVEVFKADVASGAKPKADVIDAQGRSLRATGGRDFGGALGAWEALAGVGLLLTLAWRGRAR